MHEGANGVEIEEKASVVQMVEICGTMTLKRHAGAY